MLALDVMADFDRQPWQVYPEHYETLLEAKQRAVSHAFDNFELPSIQIFASPAQHYRMRAEFKIWHEGDTASYAMYCPGEYKKPVLIQDYPVGSQLIGKLMPTLLNAINASNVLRKKLFQVEFLTSYKGEALITLIYHKALDEAWQIEAQQLRDHLSVELIGRSRKQKLLLDKDYIVESMQVDGRIYEYQQIESSFTQPNAAINEKMLNWAHKVTENSHGDLLELYCGNGNFTLPLASNFEKVLATELSKTSVRSARHNMAHNSVDNIELVRLSSEEAAQAIRRERPFRRLKHINLDDYDFSTVFVDPPRAGLDENTLDLVKDFPAICYISCNPVTLHQNLLTLCKTHRITEFALFDQFPYTDHIECGVLLQHHKPC